MTFNTSLFVSLLLILLPIANKCVSITRTQSKYTTTETTEKFGKENSDYIKVIDKNCSDCGNKTQQTSTQQTQQTPIIQKLKNSFTKKLDKITKNVYLSRLYDYFRKYGAEQTNQSTTSRQTEIPKPKETQIDISNLDDLIIKLNKLNMTLNITSINNFKEYDDYIINMGELRATEPLEMDPLAQLVDENGQTDATESHHGSNTETDDHYDVTLAPKTTVPIISTEVIGTERHTEKIVKPFEPTTGTTIFTSSSDSEPISEPQNTESGELGSDKKVETTTKYMDYYQQKLFNKSLTVKHIKNMCLNMVQDSGYWCDKTIGKLEVRYHYQKETKSCECFLYYGCLGNENNFQTNRECEDKCRQFGIERKGNKPSKDCVITP